LSEFSTPRVHCYLFSYAADAGGAEADAVAQVERRLAVAAGSLAAEGRLAYVHEVRSVAPQKTMMCVGFDLPPYHPSLLGFLKA
jgi:hypothetical protein